MDQKKNISVILVSLLIGMSFAGVTGMMGVVDAAEPVTTTPLSTVPVDFPTIQAAIDAAAPGDTINVWAGTYNENIIVNKAVNLVGNGTGVTSISGIAGDVVTITSDLVSMTDFTVTNGANGIAINYANNTNIIGNEIIGNTGYGIYITGSSGYDISYNTITANEHGIYSYFSELGLTTDYTILDMNIDNNEIYMTGANDYAIYMRGDLEYNNLVPCDVVMGSTSVSNNTIFLNGTSNYGFYVDNIEVEDLDGGTITVGDMFISDNIVYGGSYGMQFGGSFNYLTDVTVNVGDIIVNDNVLMDQLWSAISGQHYGTYDWYGNTVGTIGNLIINRNTITSIQASTRGITAYLEYHDYFYDNAEVTFGDLRVESNIIDVPGRAILVDFYDFYCLFDDSAITLGEAHIRNNTILRSSNGLVIWWEYFEDMEQNAAVVLDKTYIMDNYVNSTSSAIYLEFNEMGYDNYGFSSGFIDDVYIERNELISTGGRAIEVEYEYIGDYMYDSSSIRLPDIKIRDNAITSAWEGIEVEMDGAPYSIEGDVYMYLGGYLIDNNTFQCGGGGIDFDYYSICYDNYDQSATVLGDHTITNNIMTTGGDAIYICYDYLGDYLEDDSTLVVGDLTIADNVIFECSSGIDVEYYDVYSSDTSSVIVGECRITGNTIYNCSWSGIFVWQSSEVYGSSTQVIDRILIQDNAVYGGSGYGIYMRADYNINSPTATSTVGDAIVSKNIIDGFIDGIYIEAFENCTIYANRVSGFDSYGLNLRNSYNSLVYYNSFLGTGTCAYDNTGANLWNESYPTGGNYYYDYTGVDIFSGSNQDVLGHDEIGDTPYMLIGGGMGAIDAYPIAVHSVMVTSHSDGDLVSGITLIEAAATGADVIGVSFYVDGTIMAHDPTNDYQFVLDTTVLAEDVPIVVMAEAMLSSGINITTTVTLIPNNFVNAGNYIAASTPKIEYSPDEDVAVLIDIINAPPMFDNLDLVVGYAEPGGYTQYTSALAIPYNAQYQITLVLPSDAALGTYDVTAEAYGYVGQMLVWTANDTTQFDVVGQSVQEWLDDLNTTVTDTNDTVTDMNNTINDMNQTLEDVWNTLVSTEGNISSILENITLIRGDLTSMNTTLFDIISDIAGMNITLADLTNDLTDQLDAVNISLHTTLTDLENDFLAELAGVNATLALDIQNLLTSVTNDITGMNLTVADQLVILEGNLTTQLTVMEGNISDLNDWLDTVLTAIDSNLTQTNNTLHQHMADLETMTTDFYDNLTADLVDVMDQLADLETNLSAQHTALNDTIGVLSVAVSDQHDQTRSEILDAVNISYALLDSLDDNMTTHDTDIQALLAALDALVQNQGGMTRSQLLAETTQILADILALDQSIIAHDDDIKEDITTMSDLMSTLDQQSLEATSFIVTELANNLSAHDSAIGADLLDVNDDIGTFQTDMDAKLELIDETLGDLDKLNGIITDLEELDLALQDAEAQLSSTIGQEADETNSGIEENNDGISTNLIFLIIVLIASIIFFLLSAISLNNTKKELASSMEDKPSRDEFEDADMPETPSEEE